MHVFVEAKAEKNDGLDIGQDETGSENRSRKNGGKYEKGL